MFTIINLTTGEEYFSFSLDSLPLYCVEKSKLKTLGSMLKDPKFAEQLHSKRINANGTRMTIGEWVSLG